MKKLYYLFLGIIMLAGCTSQKLNKKDVFHNPVLAGFYPDPSICKVGCDYYMVTSSFSFFPGIPIFHSKDLVHWNQLGHVLDRPEQLNLDRLGISHGIYAPTLRYNKGTYYLVCTVVYGIGNFVLTATNPAGPWSNPVQLPYVDGMDPDIFFDTDGKAYISSCCPAPNNEPLYSGHRTIRMHEFYYETLTTDSAETILINGGTDISKKPIWCEGPHIFKNNNYYYMICAEGGTSFDHSEVVFRANSVYGPYESYEQNPILTQRNLSNDRENPITNTGHADFVQTDKGEWWSVFLACRPYKINYFNTGRETFMAPVRWESDWPTINPDFEEVQYSYTTPAMDVCGESTIPLNGNFTLTDDFSADSLLPYWYFIRTPRGNKYALDTENSVLKLTNSPETLMDGLNPAFVGRRQQHLAFEASVEMIFTPKTINERAGLALFQNESHHFFLAKTLVDDNEAVVLIKSEKQGELIQQFIIAKELLMGNSTIWLKAEGKNDVYNFYYATTQGEWKALFLNADAKFLSTEIATGFVGTAIGMHATSNGTESTNQAMFNWFTYKGNDPTFEK